MTAVFADGRIGMGLGRVLIAALLLWSGVAKALDLNASREAAAALGVPRRFARFIGAFLPFAEILLAIALLIRPLAVGAMVGAAVLFAVFTVTVVANLTKGRRPPCNCFGAAHSEPIGPQTAARNIVLTGTSVVLAATSGTAWGPDPLRWLTARGSGAVAVAVTLAVVCAVLAVESAFLVASLRQHGRLLLRVDALESALAVAPVVLPASAAMSSVVGVQHPPKAGLPVGAIAPEFVLTSFGGAVVSSTDLLAGGKPLMIVFADAACGPCHALLPTVAAWQNDPRMRASVAVLASGDREIVKAAAAEHQLESMFHDDQARVAAAFAFPGTPSAVVVDITGTIAAPMAAGADAIKALAVKFTSVPVEVGRREPSGPALGTPAPAFRLPRSGGGELSLEDLRGRPAVLLFWDPACGFCRQLAPELRNLERAATDRTPFIVLISSGQPDDNREFGLESPILNDPARKLMQSYGTNGTPIGVLIDEDGNIASRPALGGNAVLELVESARMREEHTHEPREGVA